MNRRIKRVESLVQKTLGELILSKVADPRVNTAKTSITHVEVSEDLLAAKVYVSVIGTEGEQRRAVEALRHAAGRLQELLMKRVQLRNTPVLDFQLDTAFKKTLETYRLIEQAMSEIREKEQADQPDVDDVDDTSADEPKGQQDS